MLSAGTGVFLISYADWSGLASLTAVCLILLAAFGAAGYKVHRQPFFSWFKVFFVQFKKSFFIIFLQVALKSVVGDARPDQVCLFLSLVAAFTAVVLWPIILILHFTGVEIIQPEFIPWRLLFSLGGLGLGKSRTEQCKYCYKTLFKWPSHWLIDWLIDWIFDWVILRLIDWLIDRSSIIDRVIQRVIDWLIDWIIDRVIDWLIECFDCVYI